MKSCDNGVYNNGQFLILKALEEGDYMAAWNCVCRIGHNKMKNESDRMLIFGQAIRTFDTEKNNNFIDYYSRRIGYYINTHRENWYLTPTKSVNNKLVNQSKSPEEDVTPMIAELSTWSLY